MLRKNIILGILYFFVITSFSLSAQSDFECYYCGKKISGRYLEVDGRYFHPKHFLCSRCKKVITGSFMEKDGKFYHPDCYAVSEGMICDYCHKLIKGEYVTESGKKYHQSCYENNVAEKCTVCGKPLTGEYTVDIYNNKFHSYHNRELYKCDNCGRIISEKTTGGGKEYSDGRHICNLCFKDAVLDNSRINSMLGKVISRLRSLGLNINEKGLSIKGVNKSELRRAAGGSYNRNMRGFCNSSKETEYINNRATKTTKRNVIYVLNGVPALSIESVIAHELMHVWMNDNTRGSQSERLREGSCNYISYLYLRSVNDRNAKMLIKALETDEDDSYGKGFLMVRSRFENKGLSNLLNYLKSSDSI
ncbi:MAG: protein DA1 [Bacteroidota bacterium]|nr:protein DA1 [Bacteroidota bacterium]